MSFSSTPLGQGRRLDHHTFLNKNNHNAPQRRAIPTSYSYGAPTLGSRSPPKPDKAPLPPQDDVEEPALVRFARLKQREHTQQPGPSSHPENWNVRDTSVNIVSAFHQAATSADTNAHNSNPSNTSMEPNEAWASGIRKQPMVPRSTSVEYEKETQSTINRRLAPPPNRLQQARVTRPVSKTASSRHVPDSEGEEDARPNGRTKTPLEQGFDIVRRLSETTTSFLLRERSQEPEGSLGNGDLAHDQSSYDYSAEEREFQTTTASQKPPSRRTVPAHRKNRMSTDNKAYRPSMSDLEESDEDFEEDGKRTRRKKSKKGGATGGPLTNLPVAGYDKRKRRKKGTKGNGTMGEEEEEEGSSEEDEQPSEQRSQRGTTPFQRPPSIARGSVPPPARHPSVPPTYDVSYPETSTDLEGGLGPISEVDELPPMIDGAFPPTRSSFSVGAALGRVVHVLVSATLWVVRSLVDSLAWAARTVVHLNLIRYGVVALTLYLAWYALTSGKLGLGAIPSTWGPKSPYEAPSIPASDLAAISARLQTLEKAFASLSAEAGRSHTSDTKQHAAIAGRVSSLETRMQTESIRAHDSESKFRASTSEGINAMKKEVAQLSSQLQVVRDAESRRPSVGSDQEARVMLKSLEERVGSVEGDVKEAMVLGKNAAKAGAVADSVAQWWNGLATGKTKGVTIKSSDGQDVTLLVNQLVDGAVLRSSKDILARVDFALHSAGANIIPHLTSNTVEVRPPGVYKQLIGLISGSGYAIGRPPITALHHELRTGHCWPFAGSQGQLGVKLAAPVYITDVSIDHVPKELAVDMRSAPRQMELWGLVDGQENFDKVHEWRAQRAATREAAEAAGQPVPPSLIDDAEYPRTLPKNTEFVLIANFTYNIHAPHYVQTFPVRPEIRDMGVDFGVVVLFVKNNWGMDEVTCLYRLRVHGERIGEVPLPYPEDESV